MKKSLRNIPPVITSHAVGQKRVLLSRAEAGCDLTQVAVTDLRAGEVALAHIHPDMQEGFYVLDGELEVTLSGDSFTGDHVERCRKDDFVYVESGTAHELRALTDVRVMTIGCEIQSKRNQLYPFIFKPNLHSVIWGGSRLKPWKKHPQDETPIGESWEVSAVPSSPSIIDNGCWTGQSLIDVISQMPNEILGRAVAQKYAGKLPLLVKFIDAEKDLSIQVHPDDKMALREHNKFGKTEMWYIIDAKPGACIYAGFKESITPEEYKRRVTDGTIIEALAKHEVHTGDVFYIPAGRVHGICGGILLAEVQQSSDVTYRIFDYNRPGMDGNLRPLQTELAAQAIDYKVYSEYQTQYDKPNTSSYKGEDGRGSFSSHVIDSPFFNVRIVDIDQRFHRNLVKHDSFVITMCLKGSCRIKIRSTQDEVVLHEGNSCLIPALIADYDIEPLQGHSLLLDAFIDNRKQPQHTENGNSLLQKLSRFLKNS